MKKKIVQNGRSRIQSEMANPTWTAADYTAQAVASRSVSPAQNVVATIPPAATVQQQLRVAGYCRTSTDLDSQETSIEGQKNHYRNYIENHPGWSLVDIYWETGLSGTKAETRPELQRLLSDCESHLIDLVITKSISRFSRNTSDLLEMVRKLTDLGIPIRFEKENLQTDTMGTEFLLTVLGAFSQDESRSISTNMKWGIRKRFEAGTYRAARAPYGYRKNPKPSRIDHTIYIIEPTEAEIVRRIFYACVNGKGANVIAKELNADGISTWSTENGFTATCWTESAVLNILQNIFYTGDILYQKTFVDDTYHQVKNTGQLDQYLNEGSHDAIIDKTTFEKAQEMIARRRVQYKDVERSNRYCFTGKIKCGCCGNRMYHGGTKRHFFLCYGHSHKHVCEMGMAYEDEVQNAICTMLNKLAWAEKNNVSVFSFPIESSSEEEKLDEELERIRHRKAILHDRALAEKYTAELRAKKVALDAEECAILERKERNHAPTNTDALRECIRCRGIRRAFSPDDEAIINEYVESITIWTRDRIEVRFQNGISLVESMRPASDVLREENLERSTS